MRPGDQNRGRYPAILPGMEATYLAVLVTALIGVAVLCAYALYKLFASQR